MVILVRCTDQSVSVALESKLECLISDGLITAYLGADGWVAAKSRKPSTPPVHPAPPERSRCTAYVSCF
jgi:hypothetical protein